MGKGYFARKLWIGFGILIGSVIVTALVLQFLAGKISADASTIVSDRAAAENETDMLGELATFEAAAPQAARYEGVMDQLLPDQYGIVTFPQWLSQLGQKYNVTAVAVLQGSVALPAGATPGTAQFSFSAQGLPQNVAAFLVDMNTTSSGFLIELTSFGVTNNGPNESMNGQGILFFR